MKRLQYCNATSGVTTPFVDYQLWKEDGAIFCVYSGVTHSAISTTSFANQVIAAIREEESWVESTNVQFYDIMTWRGHLLQSQGTYEFARVSLDGDAFDLDYEFECPSCVLLVFFGHIGGTEEPHRIWNGDIQAPEELKPLQF